jgi:DNA-binding NtrC family response regulator
MHERILIVGPDRNTLASLEFLLEAEGYRVATILGTVDAIALSREELPADLLILDAGRTGDNSMEGLKRFAERDMQTPAIVIASRPEKIRCGSASIEKPIRKDMLLRTVEELLRGANQKAVSEENSLNTHQEGELP